MNTFSPFSYRVPLDIGTLEKIVDAFVSVYGEERRKEIETKLSNVKIFIFKSDSDLSRDISSKKGYQSEMFREFAVKMKINNKIFNISNKMLEKRKLIYKKMRIGYSPRKSKISSITSRIIARDIKKMKIETIKKDLSKVGYLQEIDEDYISECIIPGRSCCINEMAKTRNGIEPVPIIFIDMTGDPNEVDQVIFHELNHVIETSVKYLPDEKCEVKTGWITNVMSLSSGENETYLPQNKLGYFKDELFSEIINELIAEKVARKFHDQGHSIASDPKNANYDNCIYRDVEFLIKDFLAMYYEEIVKSKLGESSELIEKIGQENFDALSTLLDKYEVELEKIRKLAFFPLFRDEAKYKMDKLKEEAKKAYKEIIERMMANSSTMEKTSSMSI